MNKTKTTIDNELIGTILDPGSNRSQISLAYTELYNKYSLFVKSFINNLVQSCDSWDKEILHDETMAKAFLKLDQYKLEYPFPVWIKSIAKNNVIDYLRKKKMPTSSIEDLEIENTNSPDRILEAKQTSSQIQMFIREQKESYREILRLRFSGMSCRTISSRLGIPLGTVSTILFRSRTRLNRIGLNEI